MWEELWPHVGRYCSYGWGETVRSLIKPCFGRGQRCHCDSPVRQLRLERQTHKQNAAVLSGKRDERQGFIPGWLTALCIVRCSRLWGMELVGWVFSCLLRDWRQTAQTFIFIPQIPSWGLKQVHYVVYHRLGSFSFTLIDFTKTMLVLFKQYNIRLLCGISVSNGFGKNYSLIL